MNRSALVWVLVITLGLGGVFFFSSFDNSPSASVSYASTTPSSQQSITSSPWFWLWLSGSGRSSNYNTTNTYTSSAPRYTSSYHEVDDGVYSHSYSEPSYSSHSYSEVDDGI